MAGEIQRKTRNESRGGSSSREPGLLQKKEGIHKVEEALAHNNLQELTKLRGVLATEFLQVIKRANDAGSEYPISVKKPPREPKLTASEWERTYFERMKNKHRAEVEKAYKDSLARKEKGVERVLLFSDTQIPNQDKKLFKGMFKFIKDFKPDLIVLNGDILDVTTLSKYDLPADFPYTFADEIKEANRFLDELQANARKANPAVSFVFRGGNHEQRVSDYLNRNAPRLVGVKNKNNEELVSLENLLDLKGRDIAWIPYKGDKQEVADVLLHHGNRVSKHAGATAMAYLNDLGRSSITGHTHRAGLVFKTLFDRVIWGMELGSTCVRKHKSEYTKDPNWQNAFGVIIVDHKSHVAYPTLIPVLDGTFNFGGKFYR